MRDDSFRDYVLDQLDAGAGITAKGMFGGHGLYRGKKFFGIVFRGKLYFKADEKARAFYVAKGMKPFRPSAKQTLKNYYEVPEDMLENPEELLKLAREAARI